MGTLSVVQSMRDEQAHIKKQHQDSEHVRRGRNVFADVFFTEEAFLPVEPGPLKKMFCKRPAPYRGCGARGNREIVILYETECRTHSRKWDSRSEKCA